MQTLIICFRDQTAENVGQRIEAAVVKEASLSTGILARAGVNLNVPCITIEDNVQIDIGN